MLATSVVISTSSPLQLARLVHHHQPLLALLCNHAHAAATAALTPGDDAAGAAATADTTVRLCLQALTAAICNEALLLGPADVSAVLCASACSVSHLEARASPASLPSAGSFNAAYFLLFALLKHRMALVHQHGAPLLLAALRGMLRALGASQQGGGEALDGGSHSEAPPGSARVSEPPHADAQVELPLRLPLECTRHVARLLEEVAAKAHRKAFVRHAAHLLADTVSLFVHRPPPPDHRAELLPGVHALLGLCTPIELQECLAGSDGMSKRALKTLWETYEAMRFKGNV